MKDKENGIAIAKQEGKFKGRQVKAINEEQFNRFYEEYKTRKINKKQLGEKLNITQPTLRKLLQDRGLV